MKRIWSALAISLLLLGCSSPKDYSKVLPTEKPSSIRTISLLDKVPYSGLKAASMFLKLNEVIAPRNYIRAFVITATPDLIQKNRSYAIKNNWSPKFIKEYDAAIEWATRLRKSGAKRIYELSKEMANKPGPTSYITLSRELLFAAIKMGLPEARFDLAQEYLSKADYLLGPSKLRNLANDNYMPAIMDIAARYEEGRGFKKDYAKAFYWYARASLKGADVDRQLESLRKYLSYDDYLNFYVWTAGVPPFE